MVSILSQSKHELNWLDTEKQIYDEDSSSDFEIKFFGFRIWHRGKDTNAKHQIHEKGGRTIGFKKEND